MKRKKQLNRLYGNLGQPIQDREKDLVESIRAFLNNPDFKYSDIRKWTANPPLKVKPTDVVFVLNVICGGQTIPILVAVHKSHDLRKADLSSVEPLAGDDE